MKKPISTTEAPAAIGPYCQAIQAGGFLFLSGQIPLDPSTGQVVEGDIEAQTERVIQNLIAVLGSANAKLEHVVKTTVFLKDMDDFARMNAVYGKHFVSPAPARSTVEAARLPRDVRVEIDVIALAP
jgi:2-iminobutanoate/2-iminopropanoate deaminase